MRPPACAVEQAAALARATHDSTFPEARVGVWLGQTRHPPAHRQRRGWPGPDGGQVSLPLTCARHGACPRRASALASSWRRAAAGVAGVAASVPPAPLRMPRGVGARASAAASAASAAAPTSAGADSDRRTLPREGGRSGVDAISEAMPCVDLPPFFGGGGTVTVVGCARRQPRGAPVSAMQASAQLCETIKLAPAGRRGPPFGQSRIQACHAGSPCGRWR